MNTIGTIYKRLGELLTGGQADQAREYLVSEIQNLPQPTRDEILFELFIDAVQSEARGKQIIAQIQEKGVTAAEALLDARDSLKVH